MKDRDERSRGIVPAMVVFVSIIKPTVPFRLVKHEDLRKGNWSDSGLFVYYTGESENESSFQRKEVKFISSRIKRGEGQGKEKCHAKSMMSSLCCSLLFVMSR